MNDLRILHSPAAERNRGPILEVLERVLPGRGTVLEVASGTGQHVVHFAAALPDLLWQPSDPEPRNRASIEARIEAAGLANVLAPLNLDVTGPWPELRVAAVIVANLLHVSAPATTAALCAGAAGVLEPGGILLVYGPFNRDGRYTSEGNARFDAELRARHPDWGIRDVEDLIARAGEAGLAVAEIVDMPANNLAVVFTAP